MSVVVTGGAGFIGSHTAVLLASRGYRVVVVDDYSSPSPLSKCLEGVGGIKLRRADIADYESLVEIIRGEGGVEAIIHLAAIVSVEEGLKRPLEVYRVNALGTLSVLEASIKTGVGRVVVASSAAVYGEPRYLPIKEDHPLAPTNLYGESKHAAENLVALYNRMYGVSATVLRYFNVYGPGMRPGPYAGVIYRFAEALLERRPPTIYGHGYQTRDFIYVGDVAEANAAALRAKVAGVFNIGSGVETSINKLYSFLCTATRLGDCPSPVYRAPRPGDVERSLASIERARRVLGWKPRVGLVEGLRRVLEWLKRPWDCSFLATDHW